MPGLYLSRVQDETVYMMMRLVVRQDGSVSFVANYYNSQTWEDEFPYPEGYQCVLEESVKVFYASGNTKYVKFICILMPRFSFPLLEAALLSLPAKSHTKEE